jgi:hypothetical protein
MIIQQNPFEREAAQAQLIQELTGFDVIYDELQNYDPRNEEFLGFDSKEEYQKWLETGGAKNAFMIYEDEFLNRAAESCAQVITKIPSPWVAIGVVHTPLCNVSEILGVYYINPKDSFRCYRSMFRDIIPRLHVDTFYSMSYTKHRDGIMMLTNNRRDKIPDHIVFAPLATITSILGDEVLLDEHGVIDKRISTQMTFDMFYNYLSEYYFDPHIRAQNGLIDPDWIINHEGEGVDAARKRDMHTFFRLLMNDIFMKQLEQYEFNPSAIITKRDVNEMMNTFDSFIRQHQ